MRARRIAPAAAATAALAAAASPLWAPPLLVRIDWFRAERVEVSGTRLLAPHEALAASGIRLGVNVWTDPAAWEAALRRHPVVAEATVERRLPRTLRIRVVEKAPAALVEAPTLRPVTAAGELLPVDPGRVRLDLPLLRAGRVEDEERIGDERTRAALAEAGRLAELDPELMARVSELRAGPDGGVRLTLSAPRAEVLLPAGAGDARLAVLHAALGDVERRLAGADTAGAPRRRAQVDLRWADQVVVRVEG